MNGNCGQRFGAFIIVAGTLAGIAATASGLRAMLTAPDAASDFAALTSKCAVTAVYHEQQSVSRYNHASKDSNEYCDNVFTYEFAWCREGNACVPAAAPAFAGNTTARTGYTPSWSSAATEIEVYREWWVSFPPPAAFGNAGWESLLLASEPISVSLVPGECTGSFDPADSPYHAGNWVTCYQPTGAVDERYACGNVDCIKLQDPSLDLEEESRMNSEALYVGIGIFVFFASFGLCGWWRSGFSCRLFFCGGDGDESSSSEDAVVKA